MATTLHCPECLNDEHLSLVVERYILRNVDMITVSDEGSVEWSESLDNPDEITQQSIVGWKCRQCGTTIENYGKDEKWWWRLLTTEQAQESADA